MLIQINHDLSDTNFISPLSINEAIGENEKKLEEFISDLIGDVLFPELLVFGNERNRQREPDIFAVNGKGDLVIFELKVEGHFDRSKSLQAMDYAQRYSYWKYHNINQHYQKCINDEKEFIDVFEEHFGYKIDLGEFNKSQKIIVISHSSSVDTSDITRYWHEKGIDIQEYYYRFYEIHDNLFFELSNELYAPVDNTGHCWINTNERYGEFCYLDMVKNHKVAAYGSRSNLINKKLNKAMVFLYHNGYGIIGAGIGTARTVEDYYEEEGYGDDEISMHLKDFISGVNSETGEIEQYISVYRIKELLKRDFYFANTIVKLDEDEAQTLFEECKRIFVRKL